MLKPQNKQNATIPGIKGLNANNKQSENIEGIKEMEKDNQEEKDIFSEYKDISLSEGQKILDEINGDIEEKNIILEKIIRNNKGEIEKLEESIGKENEIENKNKEKYEKIINDINVFEQDIKKAENTLKSLEEEIDKENNNIDHTKKINELNKQLEKLKLKNEKNLTLYKNNIENFFFLRYKK